MIAESTFECRIYIGKLERYSEHEGSPSPEILQSTFEKKDWGLVSQGHLGKHVQVCLVQWPAGRDSRMSSHCLYCLWVGELGVSVSSYQNTHSWQSISNQLGWVGGS